MSGETGNIGRGVEASCSGKPDSKTEEKYQENFRKAVNKVHELFGVSCSPSWAYDERHEIMNVGCLELRQINLPALKKKPFSIAFIIYGTSQSKERSYSVVRNGHAKLEQVAEQVYYPLREIWISDCSSRSEPLSYSKVSQTQKRLENLNSTRLPSLILICQEFFDGICIVDKPIYDNPSTTQVWKKVVKLDSLVNS
ncbi:hypothetical protein Pst134EA_031436 [Puccinia striiformis f. sp. tritici]|uniref:uncharacterized protein n=1 Tax=Puccinia striiformis f. sp. tritici TaxID=168172 RepID=UPI0020078B12|nr:uncharacterized protein Pst134EA_031436 [Puccinia striiformis f. sp. tritici]KAH9440764.1 hypothetical protein Pst134EA_031436 [Puccinia striiformis f. sp. tritici]